MTNPWLHIPLEDYEGHMALPQVGQAQLLADVLAGAVEQYRPRSVAVLGCAGGNGFERLVAAGCRRVVGVDVNATYVQRARERFGGRIPQLELLAGDIQSMPLDFDPVELVYAGLLLEYVDVEVVMGRVGAMLVGGGRLVAVVQLPCAAMPEVTPSPYTSLAGLAPVMHLVEPQRLRAAAVAHGLGETGARVVTAAGGKQFSVQEFQCATCA